MTKAEKEQWQELEEAMEMLRKCDPASYLPRKTIEQAQCVLEKGRSLFQYLFLNRVPVKTGHGYTVVSALCGQPPYTYGQYMDMIEMIRVTIAMDTKGAA